MEVHGAEDEKCGLTSLIKSKIMEEKNMNKKTESNQKYIVRCDRAGVFYGGIKERRGDEVTMTNVRKLWYWDGACAVEQLAMEGTKKPGDCQFTVTVPEMELMGVIQVLPCTEAAVASIEAVREWKR